jgi:predicted amidohydrolase
MEETILGFLAEMKVFRPDIICLPETFTYYGTSVKASFGESAESLPYPSLVPYQQFARDSQCYLICPIMAREDGRAYNAAVVIDRQGEFLGNYKKIHPTIGEMEEGVFPGPLDPPVFDLDFGRIGIQICFDIEWKDGWEALKKKDPDIIFWPSAFPGRRLIQTKAWECSSYTVSSTIKGPSRICDFSGKVIAQTEFWNRNWICAPVNLERILIHTWPYVKQFPAIKAKYGRDVSIETFDEEEWSLLESLSPEIKIREVLDEFGILSLKEHIARAEKVQLNKRAIEF